MIIINKFIKSTFILLIGGLITKIIGMFIRIIMSRNLGPDGMGVYSLLMPTFSLMIALSQFGFPISLSKLISEKKRNNFKLMISVIPIFLIINFILIIFMFTSSNTISTVLLHEERCKLGLICIGLTLPFISTSSILRGYYFGKEKMVPHVLSNVVEDLVRMLLMYFGIPYFLRYGIDKCVAYMILTNIVSESISIIVLLLFLPKKIDLTKQEFKIDPGNVKDIISIGAPATGNRIIGNIGYFLEPIILTSLLLFSGYDKSFIVKEYGIINGYVMPLLTLPSFFTSAISHALLPSISYNYVNNQKHLISKKLREAILISLLVGIPATIIFLFFPDKLLDFIYNTNSGISYVKFLAIPFILHYVQAPISACLQAMGKLNNLLLGTVLGIIIRLVILSIFSLLHVGLYGLLVSIIGGIMFTTLFDYYHLKRHLKGV